MGALLHMRPELAEQHFADVEFAQPEVLCDSPLNPTRCFESADLTNGCGGDVGVSVGFATGFSQESQGLCASVVLGASDVLQFRGAVVDFAPLRVVDLMPIRSWPEERTSYQLVNEKRPSLAVFGEADTKVSVSDRTRTQDVPTRQSATPARAAVHPCNTTPAHSPEITDFVQTLVPNDCFPLFAHGRNHAKHGREKQAQKKEI